MELALIVLGWRFVIRTRRLRRLRMGLLARWACGSATVMTALLYLLVDTVAVLAMIDPARRPLIDSLQVRVYDLRILAGAMKGLPACCCWCWFWGGGGGGGSSSCCRCCLRACLLARSLASKYQIR